jgi:hypothetical protein
MKYNYYFPQDCQFNKIKAWQPIVFFKDGIDYSQFNLLTFEWCLLETKNFHCVLLKHIKFHIRKHGLQRKG